MKRRIESICNLHFARTLLTAAVGGVALGVMVTPALAGVVVYGSLGYYAAPPATVYAPASASAGLFFCRSRGSSQCMGLEPGAASRNRKRAA